MDRAGGYRLSSIPLSEQQVEPAKPQPTGPEPKQLQPVQRLFRAIHDHDLNKMEQILAEGVPVDCTPQGAPGLTALFFAVNNEKDLFVCKLLEKGANPKLERPDGTSAWSVAAKKSPKVFKMMEDSQQKITNMVRAVTQGDLGRIRRVLAAGLDINSANTAGVTALHLAVKQGNEEIVAFLLERGANPELKDNSGASARSLAPKQANKRIARMIEDHLSGVQELERLMGDLKVAQAFDAHYLEACRRGDIATIKKLAASGEVNLNALEDKFLDGGGALHIAVDNRHHELIPFLVEMGVNPNATDMLGRPPLFVAVQKQDLVAVGKLISCGAKVNPGSHDLLYMAIEMDHYAIAKRLWEEGASLTFRTEGRDDDALRLAMRKGGIWHELVKQQK
jgi:ankyrin repeat protein